MTLGYGDEGKTNGEYIKLRFQSLIDENTVMAAIENTIITEPKIPIRSRIVPEARAIEPDLPIL